LQYSLKYGNFNDLSSRNDVGMLWENFLFIERMKKRHYSRIFANEYFWRTYDKKEIDLVEERGGHLWGYEFKWGLKKPKTPKIWLETYENAHFEVINRENFLEFIL
jgi:predicted AAA+ superfamily ATPase